MRNQRRKPKLATYLTADPKNPLNGKPVGTSLETLQKAVAGGGLVTFIPIPEQPNLLMVVDQEGLWKNYRFNVAASLLSMDAIVGDVVIAHSKEID